MIGRAGLRRVTTQITLFVGVGVVLRMLVTEGYSIESSAYRRYEPPGSLLPHQEQYVKSAQEHIEDRARVARAHRMRFMAVALISGVSALAIPLAVALRAPSWVSAVLGFATATGQFVQGLSRDREQYAFGHQAVVRLRKVVRDFLTDAGELYGPRLRDRFKEFQRSFEEIKDEHDTELLKVRGQEPPQIGGVSG